MVNIENTREKMFEILAGIQELAVVRAQNNLNNGDDFNSIFNELTYETIYYVMEMIDGYTSSEVKIDLVDRETNTSLREGCELHDLCSKYLKTE